MNRNIITVFSLLIAFLILGLSSCRKNPPETPFERIIGKWKKVKFATDDNRNGKIDDREISLVESSVNNELLFKADSTGIETTNSSPELSFRWKILGTASLLVQYSANDTITYAISNLSLSDLTLTTETKLGLAWYYYIKE